MKTAIALVLLAAPSSPWGEQRQRSSGSVSAPAGTQTTQRFGPHAFTMTLPGGYKLQRIADPNPATRMFAFATEARADGTQGLIQVSLFDLGQLEPAAPVDLAVLAHKMIGGVQALRSSWNASESDEELLGVKVKRIEWSGIATPPRGSPVDGPRAMRGVMIVGIRGQLAFQLHTQDFDPLTTETLPLGERALRSFEVRSTAH